MDSHLFATYIFLDECGSKLLHIGHERLEKGRYLFACQLMVWYRILVGLSCLGRHVASSYGNRLSQAKRIFQLG